MANLDASANGRLRNAFRIGVAASLLAGYGMTGSKVRSWLHMIGFALVMAFAVMP